MEEESMSASLHLLPSWRLNRLLTYEMFSSDTVQKDASARILQMQVTPGPKHNLFFNPHVVAEIKSHEVQ